MTIHIHLVVPDRIDPGLRHLNEEERKRAASFRFEKDASHWIACRTALRMILGKATSSPPASVPLYSSADGKPLLAPPFDGIHFNLSHCHDLALVAIGLSPLGIDVEPRQRAHDLLGCEESFCHPDEIARLPEESTARANALLEIWTAKEAALKAHGTGLLLPAQRLAVDFATLPAAVRFTADLATQRIVRLDHPSLADYSAFISSGAPSPKLIYHFDI